MSYATLLVDRDPAAGVATLTLNRPERRNALTIQSGRDLEAACLALRDDPAVGAVVLTGAGKSFSAGGDLKDFGVDLSDVTQARALMVALHRGLLALAELDKPVVAAVNGDAAGAGWNLALAADLIVASTEARFIQAFVKVGVVPDLGGAFFLPRLVGPHRAKEWIFLGDVVTAAEAHRLGAVNRLVAPEAVLPTARELAARLAAGPRHALALAKQMVNRYATLDLRAALEHEAVAQALTMQTADHREGALAFAEKRTPTFTGR
ncbi:MAG TPA: enoyl-CoA hydratase-related protein [Thermodesulfobacteriota bacterium]